MHLLPDRAKGHAAQQMAPQGEGDNNHRDEEGQRDPVGQDGDTVFEIGLVDFAIVIEIEIDERSFRKRADDEQVVIVIALESQFGLVGVDAEFVIARRNPLFWGMGLLPP